jgi:predicted ATPase
MVGRDRELARVMLLLDDALAGGGRLVLFTGEAGIGKTRLAEEVAAWQSKAHMDRWTAEQLFPAFQSLGMTDVASNMEFTEYDADELYIR